MNEKVYKTMTRCGAGNIALGIIVLVSGISAGILVLIRENQKLHFNIPGCPVMTEALEGSACGAACFTLKTGPAGRAGFKI